MQAKNKTCPPHTLLNDLFWSFTIVSFREKRIFNFFKIIYLFMRNTQREAETQAEGEAGSLWGT